MINRELYNLLVDCDRIYYTSITKIYDMLIDYHNKNLDNLDDPAVKEVEKIIMDINANNNDSAIQHIYNLAHNIKIQE